MAVRVFQSGRSAAGTTCPRTARVYPAGLFAIALAVDQAILNPTALRSSKLDRARTESGTPSYFQAGAGVGAPPGRSPLRWPWLDSRPPLAPDRFETVQTHPR